MESLRTPRRLALLVALAAASAGGCIPIPVALYEPAPGQGTIVTATCSLNRHVPTGLRNVIACIGSEVSVKSLDGRWYVEWRLDVPEGTTVMLADDRVRVRYRSPDREAIARFPRVSLVDSPIAESSGGTAPGRAAYQQPLTAPLVGGHSTPTGARHFWLATFIEARDAREIELSLPDFTVNGVAVEPPVTRFRRGTTVIVATFNC